MSRKEIKEAVGKYLFLEEYPFIVYIITVCYLTPNWQFFSYIMARSYISMR
jgi:hypothetical protein